MIDKKLEVSTFKVVCPYCNKLSTVGSIETEKLRIFQCESCQKVWKVFEGKRERMIRFKDQGPDTYNEKILCPICWRIIEVDYDLWVEKCLDPTCGYIRRLAGLSKEERDLKRQYLSLRYKVFQMMSKDELIPDDLNQQYDDSKVVYESFKKRDIYNDL